MTEPITPLPPGEPARWRSSPPLPFVPLLTKQKSKRLAASDPRKTKEKRKEKRGDCRPPHLRTLTNDWPPPYHCSLGREFPDVSSYQEVHHRLIALLHRKQLTDLHTSASARFPARGLPHRFPESFLLVFSAGLSIVCSGGRDAPASGPPLRRTTSTCRLLGDRIVSGKFQWVHTRTLVGRTWQVTASHSSSGWVLLLAWPFSLWPKCLLHLSASHCDFAANLPSEIRLVLFTAEVYTRSGTVLATPPVQARLAWRLASSFPGMPVCPGTQWVSVSIPTLRRVLALQLIHLASGCPDLSTRCSVHRMAVEINRVRIEI